MPPVDDHPVHEKMRLKAGKRYGCFDRKGMAHGYTALDRYYKTDGTFVVVQKYIKHEMTTKCRYDMFKTDPRCEGCDTPKDIDYLTRMKVLK